MKKVTVLILMVFSFVMCYSQSQRQERKEIENHYESGDFINASLKSIDYLRSDQKNKKVQEIFSASYNLAVEDVFDEIKQLKESSNKFSGDATVEERKKIVESYKLLQGLDRKSKNLLRILPKGKITFDFQDIDVDSDLKIAEGALEEGIKSAAEMHYQQGVGLMTAKGRENSKAAAKEFRRANEYIPGYKDCLTSYENAKKAGTTRVAILAFENLSGVTQYGSVGEMISDKIRAKIINDEETKEFTEVYTRDQVELIFKEHDLNFNSGIINNETMAKYGEAVGIHVFIIGKVMQLGAEHNRVIVDAPVRTSANVVVGQENYVDSKGKQRTRSVWGDVFANVTHYHKTASSNINGSYEIIEVESSRILASSQFSEQYNWRNNWATYTGDKRAVRIPQGYDLSELNAPSEIELANQVINLLGNKLAADIIKSLR